MCDKSHYSQDNSGYSQYPPLSIMPGTFSPTFNEVYANLLPACERSGQSRLLGDGFMFPDLASTSWESIKLPDKDLMDIATKELSPSGYYVDTFSPVEFNQWNSYVPCKGYNNGYQVEPPKLTNELGFDPIVKTVDFNFSDLTHPPQDADDCMDIVVEDSNSSITTYVTTTCALCRAEYSCAGMQFFKLTAQTPLTMTSHESVKLKLVHLIGRSIFDSNSSDICNDCLGLVNSIDHLESQLSCLLDKLKATIAPRAVKKRLPIYRCKRCKKSVSFKAVLHNHWQSHRKRRYLCETCGITSKNLQSFRYHIQKHKNQISFKCDICHKKCKTKWHLKEHKNFCSGSLPFDCKLCTNKRFPTKTKLRNHHRLKHEKKFVAICSICNIGFVKPSDYKSHMISHSTDKKHTCKQCGKSYKTVSNLNFHLKSHGKSLPFICDVCDKGFMRKEYRDAHMNNHKNLKSFQCPVCDKRFVAQKNLDAHTKYHDGTLKGNVCGVCKKIVTSCFEEHLRVHANLKEFECDLCDLKFNTKNSLSKHKKRKHIETPGTVVPNACTESSESTVIRNVIKI